MSVLKIIVSFASSVRQSLQGGVEEVAQVLGGIFASTPNKCQMSVSRFSFHLRMFLLTIMHKIQ